MAAATVTVYGYQIARDAAAAVVVVARSVDALASRLAGVLATTGSWQQAAGTRQQAAGNCSGGSRRSGLGRVNGEAAGRGGERHLLV